MLVGKSVANYQCGKDKVKCTCPKARQSYNWFWILWTWLILIKKLVADLGQTVTENTIWKIVILLQNFSSCWKPSIRSLHVKPFAQIEMDQSYMNLTKTLERGVSKIHHNKINWIFFRQWKDNKVDCNLSMWKG